jgi:hypothetical protein
MRRGRENRGNYPRAEARGFGKRHCRVVTRVHPDPLVKLVKTRRNLLLRKEVNLQICKLGEGFRFALRAWKFACMIRAERI